MLPKLADDADAAKAVGGDRCYLSSPAACSQIVPSNKAINLIDQHISFIATFMLQLEDGVLTFTCKKRWKENPYGGSHSLKPAPCFCPCSYIFYYISVFYHYPAYSYDLCRQLNLMCFASYL